MMFSLVFLFFSLMALRQHSVERIPYQKDARMAWGEGGANCYSLNDFLLHSNELYLKILVIEDMLE